MRRKCSEWTLEPKSIQSQRQQLASLMKTFNVKPTAGIMGQLNYIREYLNANVGGIGRFPFPDIFPVDFETKFPVDSVDWLLMKKGWAYTGFGTTVAQSWYIGIIVVDVTTDPKAPRLKASQSILCNSAQANNYGFETVIPQANGAIIGFAGAGNSGFGQEFVEFVPGVDLCYVAMAMTQDVPSLSLETAGVFSYYVQPNFVLRPQLG